MASSSAETNILEDVLPPCGEVIPPAAVVPTSGSIRRIRGTRRDSVGRARKAYARRPGEEDLDDDYDDVCSGSVLSGDTGSPRDSGLFAEAAGASAELLAPRLTPSRISFSRVSFSRVSAVGKHSAGGYQADLLMAFDIKDDQDGRDSFSFLRPPPLKIDDLGEDVAFLGADESTAASSSSASPLRGPQRKTSLGQRALFPQAVVPPVPLAPTAAASSWDTGASASAEAVGSTAPDGHAAPVPNDGETAGARAASPFGEGTPSGTADADAARAMVWSGMVVAGSSSIRRSLKETGGLPGSGMFELKKAAGTSQLLTSHSTCAPTANLQAELERPPSIGLPPSTRSIIDEDEDQSFIDLPKEAVRGCGTAAESLAGRSTHRSAATRLAAVGQSPMSIACSTPCPGFERETSACVSDEKFLVLQDGPTLSQTKEAREGRDDTDEVLPFESEASAFPCFAALPRPPAGPPPSSVLRRPLASSGNAAARVEQRTSGGEVNVAACNEADACITVHASPPAFPPVRPRPHRRPSTGMDATPSVEALLEPIEN